MATSSKLVYASIWYRVAARLIDGIIVSVITAPLSIPLFFIIFRKLLDSGDIQNFSPESALYTTNESLILGALSIVIFIIGVLYAVILPATKLQGTFGKRIIGIKIVGLKGERISLGTSFKRYLGEQFLNIPNALLSNTTNPFGKTIGTVSSVLYGIYFIVDAIYALSDDKKRSLHDRIAQTYVVERK